MNKIKTLVLTGILLALLIVLQFVTKPFGQIVTGACVNFVLVAAALLVGAIPAVAVAVVSPFVALSFGIGPALVQIVPMIAIGNLSLVVCYHFVFGFEVKSSVAKWVIAIIAAAALKYAVLYFGVVKFLVPTIANGPQAEKIAAMFSIPQLITALLGGVVAFAVVPAVAKAIGIKK